MNDKNSVSEPTEILIIENNLEVIEILKTELMRHHYRVRIATDGRIGLTEAQRQSPGLISLDPILPGLNGWEVCRQLRKDPKTKTIPILILTALAEESNRIQGLNAGADDYLTKPFSLRELLARIKALLRRRKMVTEPETSNTCQIGPIVLNTDRHEVRMDGRLLRLSRTEFGILKFLMQNAGRVFRRDELLTAVWGRDRFVEEHNLDVHIHAIRRQMEPNPSRPLFLTTVRGIGYKFNLSEEET